ncbi:FAD-binding oxidoreductase [Undibacterium sp.]|jgi:FAD/FMN-containing dehydrogenase|uniref:FAD-binding oxidoreductase n=1 Tax=Undibacterium sp. TaxID=1914977 RepID=UPI002CD9D168|nr:FAD-binding oxidoreductase [Undibacterium sp.]HTD06521.1 FAD-binding oxidoreductase [Undibacterium sp.]
MPNQDKEHLAALAALVDEHGILVDTEACLHYVTGARYGVGQALAVLRPTDTGQVAAIVAYCARNRLPLVLQGANTGLVAASTPDASGRLLVLSLERMKKNIRIDAVNRSVAVDAGVTLQELNDALEPHGLCFPIDLGANPSIGGMIAANTGGARLIKYGDVRQNLLGLQAVLLDPPGQVLDMQQALRKNNTGPDLKQLFVGSSGAYGVITSAVLQVHRIPRQTATALVVPRDQAAVLQLLQTLEQDFPEFLTAFEGISGAALDAVVRHIPDIGNPFAPEALPDYCVLIELSSAASQQAIGVSLEEALTASLEKLFGDVIENAVIGRGKDLWRIRHAVSEAVRQEGKIIAFDISMPRSALVAFRSEALDIIGSRYPWLKVMDFGHWGDGGAHFNMVWPPGSAQDYDAGVVSQVRDAIYDLVVHKYHGSFSAEHGVGPYNQMYYHRYITSPSQCLAGRLQRLMDPHALLGVTWFGEQSQP